MNQAYTRFFDFTGIVSSFLCAIHCLVTPLLLIILPSLGHLLQSVWAHSALILLMLFSFHQSVFTHFRLHKSKIILGYGLAGLVFILVSYVFEISHHAHGDGHGHEAEAHDEWYIIYLALVGATLFSISHIINLKRCKCLQGANSCTHLYTVEFSRQRL